MSGIYEQRETSSGQRALSTMLSTLPVTPVLDLQLVKAEQIPQCLCFTELLTGCHFLFLTWLLDIIFQPSGDLLEKPLCYFSERVHRGSLQSSLNFKAFKATPYF